MGFCRISSNLGQKWCGTEDSFIELDRSFCNITHLSLTIRKRKVSVLYATAGDLSVIFDRTMQDYAKSRVFGSYASVLLCNQPTTEG